MSAARRPLTVPEEPNPNEPMKIGKQNIQTFKVTRSTRPNCPLLKKRKLDEVDSSTTYSVLKEKHKDKGGKTHFYFFAVHGSDFVLNDKITEEDKKSNPGIVRTHRFLKQVGFIDCPKGQVFRLDVNKEPTDGRRCGIGTVLSQLCLIDPEIYEPGKQNDATKILLDDMLHESPDAKVADWLMWKCERLVAIHVQTIPRGAGKTYLQAGLKTGFETVAIIWKAVPKKISIYKTKLALENFKPQTGSIGPCEGHKEECNAFNQKWIFCRLPIFQ